MTDVLGILCYHRIIDERDAVTAWPYLERGTAVSLGNFCTQVAEVERFADIVAEEIVLEVLAGRRHLTRPAVWVTFDDGYLDVLRALPCVETGTAFVTSGASDRRLPADAWYAVLIGATRTRGTIDLGRGPFEYDLAHRDGRARLVNGPERRAYLRASATTQDVTLRELATKLDACVATSRIYLDASDLGEVLAAGWTLGAHGATHVPFDAIGVQEMLHEARTSIDMLRACGAKVRSFALPDGTRPSSPTALLSCGCDCLLALGDQPAVPGDTVQPRFLVPDDPHWVGQVLRPVLERASHA